MENAANALCGLIGSLTHKGSVVTIVCGSGDNGADGYALARKLQGSYITRIYEAKEPKSRLCKLQSERAQVAGVEWIKKLLPCDVIVDCLFGSGFAGELGAEFIKLLEQMNTCARLKIACDVPSGLDLQGRVESYAFSADYTLSMGALKVALFSDVAKDLTGKVLVGDLGVSRELFEVQSPFYLLEESDLCLPHRTKHNCHKGSFGHIAVIAGEKAGAAELSAMGGLRMGAGLVSVVSRDCALGEQGRVGFLLKKPASATPCTASLVLAKNGDCGGESALITTQGKSLDSPCKAPFLAQKSYREQTALESTFSQSPTANPRILMEESQAESENLPQSCREQLELESTFEQNEQGTTAKRRILADKQAALESSSRDLPQQIVAIHNQNADSSLEAMDCHASTSALARNDGNNNQAQNADSRQTAQNVAAPQTKAKVDSKSEAQTLESTFENTPTTAQKVDSSTAQNLNNSAQDSKSEAQTLESTFENATTLSESQAAGFADDFWGFQAVGAGIYLVGNEQAYRAESPKSAAKPTPKPSQAQSLYSTITTHSELMYPHAIPPTANVLCLGMGLGSGYGYLLEPSFIGERLCVLDADVFYESTLPNLLESTFAHNLVLTPHPKEFHALLHLCGLFSGDIAEVANNRFELALRFSQAYKSPTLLLKGASPIIAHNAKLYINPLGTPALAKGGSGDVLSGVIAAYLAQGFSPLQSAINASLAHALAATKEKNTYALTPLRLIEHLGTL